MRIHVAFSLAALMMSAVPAPAQDTTLAARIRRVESGLATPVVVAGRPDLNGVITDRMRAHNTPAVSIAVINGGRIEWARAYGTLQAGGSVPADTATLFQAASISKPVATLGMLRLMERGQLSLDEDVNGYLRAWRVPENAFTAREKVTLRRITSHSAGLTVSGFPGYAADSAMPTTVQILDGQRPANTAPVRVDTLPGSRLRYSGGGMTVMQQLLVDLTGRPFPLFMRETVLLPLGMVHSSYEQDVTADRAARIARAHGGDGSPTPGGWHRYPEMAAAGLWTTPLDLARFALAVQSAFGGVEGGVVSPALARQILTQQSGGADGGFGLGMEVHPVGAGLGFGHSGSNEGYRARMVAFTAKGQGAVVMTNSDAGGELIMEILRALAVEYGWPEFRPVEKTAVALDRDAPAYAPGRYQGTFQGETIRYTIEAADGALRLANPNWPAPRILYPASTTEARFFVRESEREYTVERDASGRAVRIRVSGGGGAEFVAERIPD
ncbi:MAG TPA: serine hydrolase domain-containing protein [Longimicrobium sp.]|jgi:CubicO group peptidase (beta-lactamase class C family)|uniref:serine hydrolase domain-containing protein n=1 Tax=Longimicrobium sp. TaxID=2029185 RepID=UPI002ED7C536